MTRLHEHARRLAAQHDLALRAVVLSNGVALSPRLLAWLREQDVRLMISLDGVGTPHDVQRPLINGQGSFGPVMRGIDAALSHGIVPHLSITVTAATADHVAEAVDFALDHDLPFNLNFYRDYANTGDARAWRADDERLIRGVRAAFARIEARLPRRRLIDALVDRSAFDAPHTRACGAGHHYLVVDHRGRVARCHMEIERPITHVWAEDPLEPVRTRGEGFHNVPVDEKAECRTCTWRYWCAGGCPLLTFRVTGRNDVKSPYCHVYRALYPHVVRLEGLRLLKWGTPWGP
ncbi:MAG: SPASM domain-containing protein [Ardenticatenia bacterium]|nr:SPASM domain-containing protein [Ardenticatenia bacterium]